MRKDSRKSVRRNELRHRSAFRKEWSVVPLALAFVLLLATPVLEELPDLGRRAMRAQEIVEELRSALHLDYEVRVDLVVHHPLVFSVEPAVDRKDSFVLSMELRFLQMLDDDELRAALAHELGHVWVFTHHPFLQTERLANEIGLGVVRRDSLEKVYKKLWNYERSSGVPMEQLLGPVNPEPLQ